MAHKTALILPAEGSRNLGNEIICQATRNILKRIESHHLEIEEFTYLKRPSMEAIERINKCDQAIFVGTNIFQPHVVGWEWLTEDLEQIEVPYYLYGVGYSGPLQGDPLEICQETKQLVHWSQEADAIGVRDPHTMRWLKRFGVPSDLIGCPVIDYADAPRSIAPGEGSPVLAVRQILLHNPSDEAVAAQHAMIDWFFKEYPDGVAVVQGPSDLGLLRDQPVITDFNEIVRVLSQARFVFSTRLHAGMLALSYGLPTVFLAHDTRVASFCEMVGLPSRQLSFEGLETAIYAVKAIERGDLTEFRGAAERIPRLRGRLERFLALILTEQTSLHESRTRKLVVQLQSDFHELKQQFIELREHLQSKEQELTVVREELSLWDRKLVELQQVETNLREQLRAQEEVLQQMEDQLQNEKQIGGVLRRQLEERDRRIAELNQSLDYLQKALAQIYSSLGWRLLARFWRLTEWALPTGTRRRLWFNRGLYAIKVVINEGWGSLWQRIKQKIRSLRKKTKLMIVVPAMVAGGAERRTFYLLQRLDRRHISPELTIISDQESFYPIPRDVPVHVLKNLPHPTEQLEIKLPAHLAHYEKDVMPWFEQTAFKLAQLVKERECEVVLATQLYASIITTLAHKYMPPQVRVAVNVDVYADSLGLEHEELHRYLMREYFNAIDKVVPVCEGVGKGLVEHFGVKPEKIEVIYNPIDNVQIQRQAQEPVEHPWFGEDIPIVLFVGRLEGVKGLEHLLRALARARESVRVRCVLVGEGKQREELEELARQLGISKDVLFLGRQSNPFKYMKRATVFVLPSLSEGLPNVLIEALACGCAVVASDVASGGSREVLGGGEYGVLVPPGDEGELAGAILRLLRDPALRERFAQRGPDQAKTFDMKKSIDQYTKLITSLRQARLSQNVTAARAVQGGLSAEQNEVKRAKTKVLCLVPSMGVAGGAERNTALILEHLDRQRFEAELVTVFDREIVYALPENVPLHVLERLPDPHQGLGALTLPPALSQDRAGRIWLEKIAMKLAKLVKERDVEAVFATETWASIIAVLARKYMPSEIRIIAMVTNHPSTRLPSQDYANLKGYLIKEHFNDATRVIAVGQGVRQDLEEHFGVKPERIEVIYNPIDYVQIQRQAQEPVEHPWFGEDIPIVLFVGRLERVKGLEHLLRALARARESVRVRCVLVGEGKQREELEELARQLGISKDVLFLGRQSNPFKYMKRATVFVLPSLSEGLPNVLIEALACGCAVVASDVASGGSREVLGGGEYGVLVPPGDEGELASAILRLVRDPVLRQRFAQRGPDQAKTFDISGTIRHYAVLLRKMKIFFIVPTMQAGGVERCTAILLKHFDRELFEPSLIMIHDNKSFYELPSDIKTQVLAHESQPPIDGYLISLFPEMVMKYQNSLTWLEATARKLGAIIAQQHPEAVIAQDFFASIIALLAKRLIPNSSKIICGIHNHYSQLLPTSQHGDLHAVIMKRCLNEADRIVAVSQGILGDLVHNFRTQHGLIAVVRNPVDLGEVAESAKERVTEHQWFNEDVPIFLFVGRLNAQKGLTYLLQAIKSARQAVPFRTVIIGEGEQHQELEVLARQLKVTDDICFLRRQNNPFKFMKRATAFVLPSVVEGLPYVLLEAMACGCPIIATDCAPGIRELLADGQCGLLVPPKDPTALAQAMLDILSKTELRERLKQEGLDQVKEFSAKKIVAQYEEIVKTHVKISSQ